MIWDFVIIESKILYYGRTLLTNRWSSLLKRWNTPSVERPAEMTWKTSAIKTGKMFAKRHYKLIVASDGTEKKLQPS